MTSSYPQRFPTESITAETLRAEGLRPLFKMECADAARFIISRDGSEPLTDEEFDLLRSAIPQRGNPVPVDEGWARSGNVYALKTPLSAPYTVRVVGDRVRRRSVSWNERVVYSVTGIRALVLSRRIAPNDRGIKDILALVAEEDEEKGYTVRLRRYPALENS